MIFVDAIKTTKIKYFTAHALINPLNASCTAMQIIIVNIRYGHVFVLIVTSLRKCMLSNDTGTLQDPLHAGAYRLVIISVVTEHVMLVIFPGIYNFTKGVKNSIYTCSL